MFCLGCGDILGKTRDSSCKRLTFPVCRRQGTLGELGLGPMCLCSHKQVWCCRDTDGAGGVGSGVYSMVLWMRRPDTDSCEGPPSSSLRNALFTVPVLPLETETREDLRIGSHKTPSPMSTLLETRPLCFLVTLKCSCMCIKALWSVTTHS